MVLQVHLWGLCTPLHVHSVLLVLWSPSVCCWIHVAVVCLDVSITEEVKMCMRA